jgi:hypothetical protein
MTAIANGHGALYELLNRGNKDAFFIKDDKYSTFLFQNGYKPQTPFLQELRYDQATTSVEFGRTCEFELVVVGDIMTQPTLVIDLPSWLPSTEAALNPRALITDTSGVSFGYTNGIAYFLFERIELYQDMFLIQQWTGESLWAFNQFDGTFNKSLLHDTALGTHDGTPLQIARNATPPRLRLPLPFPGCQTRTDTGFPQRCLTEQKYKLKLKLRKLEDLVEASDRRPKPIPWSGEAAGQGQFQIQTSALTPPTPFQTLLRTSIPPLKLQLETTQIYLLDVYQTKLERTTHRIPFPQIYESVFTQGAADYTAIRKGGISIVARLLDTSRHPAGRMAWFFRSQQDILANRYVAVTNNSQTHGSYYNKVTFYIAGQPHDPTQLFTLWKDIVVHAKEELDPNTQLSVMDWTRGSTFQGAQTDEENAAQPEGSVNFTTADRPTLTFDLADTPTQSTELRVFVEGWSELVIEKGRGSLFSAN